MKKINATYAAAGIAIATALSLNGAKQAQSAWQSIKATPTLIARKVSTYTQKWYPQPQKVSEQKLNAIIEPLFAAETTFAQAQKAYLENLLAIHAAGTPNEQLAHIRLVLQEAQNQLDVQRRQLTSMQQEVVSLKKLSQTTQTREMIAMITPRIQELLKQSKKLADKVRAALKLLQTKVKAPEVPQRGRPTPPVEPGPEPVPTEQKALPPVTVPEAPGLPPRTADEKLRKEIETGTKLKHVETQPPTPRTEESSGLLQQIREGKELKHVETPPTGIKPKPTPVGTPSIEEQLAERMRQRREQMREDVNVEEDTGEWED